MTPVSHAPPPQSPDPDELIQLILQALQDRGLWSSAVALSAEAGVLPECENALKLKRAVSSGEWSDIDAVLDSLWPVWRTTQGHNVAFVAAEQQCKDAICLGFPVQALAYLRGVQAASLSNRSQLRSLSSYILEGSAKMGSIQANRRQGIARLQDILPCSVLLPEGRLNILLAYARTHQISICAYHTMDTSFSLLADHSCSRAGFPTTTYSILTGHSDEIWTLSWSADGKRLATGSADRCINIWAVQPQQQVSLVHVLRGHISGVSCVAWSADGHLLVTSADACIKCWDTVTGNLIMTLQHGHLHSVTALQWMPGGSSFMSAGMDNCIIFWDTFGKIQTKWRLGPYRVVSAAITPDGRKLVAVGHAEVPLNGSSATAPHSGLTKCERRVQIYDIATRSEEAFISHPREMVCVTVTRNSQYALVGHASDELLLYSLSDGELVQRFRGHKSNTHVISSCFGGASDGLVVSGSEDGKIYIWKRDTGKLVEVLDGHSGGSVNSVAWNPVDSQLLASAGDDHCVRLWRPPSDDDDSSVFQGV